MGGGPLWRQLRSVLIGVAAGLGLTALGLDTSVSLSTYGLYLGSEGPYLVIAGVPAFLNVVLAFVLIRGERKLMRYSMVAAGVASAAILGFFAFQGIFQGLLGE